MFEYGWTLLGRSNKVGLSKTKGSSSQTSTSNTKMQLTQQSSQVWKVISSFSIDSTHYHFYSLDIEWIAINQSKGKQWITYRLGCLWKMMHIIIINVCTLHNDRLSCRMSLLIVGRNVIITVSKIIGIRLWARIKRIDSVET